MGPRRARRNSVSFLSLALAMAVCLPPFPVANSIKVSLVEVSLSTVMELNDGPTPSSAKFGQLLVARLGDGGVLAAFSRGEQHQGIAGGGVAVHCDGIERWAHAELGEIRSASCRSPWRWRCACRLFPWRTASRYRWWRCRCPL